MEATAPRRVAPQTSWLDQALDLSRVNWEAIAYAIMVVVLLGTRFWDLGSRALHHDESIHAYYSYQQYLGNPWPYDPAYHGPFLYNIVALGFLLFGSTDATVRVMPAIFGTLLVGLCFMLRPYLGRIGALTAGVLVTFSPSIMYYSRSLRHDIFALTGTMLLFVAILGFIRNHQARWVLLGALGLGIAYTSHELVFINVAFFISFLFFAWVWLQFRGAPGDYNGAVTVNPISEAVRALFSYQRYALLGGIAIFVTMYVLLFSNWLTYTQGLLDGLTRGLTYWFTQHQDVNRGNQPIYYYALLLMPIYEMLAYVAGFATLIGLSIMALRGRAGFPADLPAEAYPDRDDRVRGTDALTSEGVDEVGFPVPSAALMAGLTTVFLAWWSFGALIAYSLAGERMPWLNMEIALPFSLLAAVGIGRFLQSVNWRTVLGQGGAFLGILLILIIFAALSFIANLPGVTNNPLEISQQQALMRALVLAAFMLLMVGGVAWLWLRIGGGNGWRVLALTAVLIGLIYGVRSTWMLNFRNGDTPVEMLVYTQSAPDTVLLANRIIRLGRDLTAFTDRNSTDVTGGHSMQIGMDSTVEWPFDWYFRDQLKISRFASHDASGALVALASVSGFPNGSPVFLVSDDFQAQNDFQAAMKDKYTGAHYKLRWWFPEDQTTYKIPLNDAAGNPVLDPTTKQQVWDVPHFVGTWFGTLFNPTAWARPLKYLIYRDPGTPLGSTDVWLYVRNDLLNQTGNVLGDLNAAATAANPPPVQAGPTYGLFDLGPEGSGNGQFSKPRGMAQAPDGSFYVVDTGNLRVEKFDKNGKFLLAFGSNGTDDGQFQALVATDGPAAGTGPGGIVVDSKGNVYVADTWNHRVQKFDAGGKFLKKWGTFVNLGDAATDASTGAGNFFGPRGMAVDSQDNVYVTDTGNRRVEEFDGNGKFLRQFAQGLNPQLAAPGVANNAPNQLNEPIGLAVDAQGNVYIADTNNQRIVKYDKNAAPVTNWAVDGFAPGQTNEPFMAIGPDGNLYVTSPTGQKVMKYDPTGKLLGTKNSSGATSLSRPTGIVVDKTGTVYISDTDKPGVIKLGAVP